MSKTDLVRQFSFHKHQCDMMLNKYFNFSFPPKVQPSCLAKPEWSKFDIDIASLPDYKNQEMAEVDDSMFKLDGMKFYMLAYPNGFTEEDQGHLSVFIGFDKPTNQPLQVKYGRFEYKLAVVNKLN